MPRKDNSNIRRVTLRLDVSDPQQAAVWERYQIENGNGSTWIRKTLADSFKFRSKEQNAELQEFLEWRKSEGDSTHADA